MDELTESIIDRERDLAKFDHGRDDFEAAFARVPDEALEWKPEGDDYTIGFLVPHVISSMANYSTVLDLVEASGDGVVAPGWEAGGTLQDYNAKVLAIYAAGAGRDAVIDELDAVHDRMASRLRKMAYEEYGRQSPVHYGGSPDPYPTSAHDIIGWLTDHYYEHVPHIEQLLEGWEKSKK
jgi:DinB superfamily